MIEFVFMLTRDDVTVGDALAVLETLRSSGLRYVGFKDVGAAPAVLAEVADVAHASGMEVMLEVVSVSREDELRSLRAAREIGVDWVLGGTHPRDGAEILQGVRYCPFAGTVEGHPSVLRGELEAIAHQVPVGERPARGGVAHAELREPHRGARRAQRRDEPLGRGEQAVEL